MWIGFRLRLKVDDSYPFYNQKNQRKSLVKVVLVCYVIFGASFTFKSRDKM